MVREGFGGLKIPCLARRGSGEGKVTPPSLETRVRGVEVGGKPHHLAF